MNYIIRVKSKHPTAFVEGEFVYMTKTSAMRQFWSYAMEDGSCIKLVRYYDADRMIGDYDTVDLNIVMYPENQPGVGG